MVAFVRRGCRFIANRIQPRAAKFAKAALRVLAFRSDFRNTFVSQLL